jgi:hypothetical protein
MIGVPVARGELVIYIGEDPAESESKIFIYNY